DQKHRQGKEVRRPKWHALHQETFQKNGIAWPPVVSNVYSPARVKALSGLPARCVEIVVFHDLANPLSEVGPEEVIDLNNAITRSQVDVGCSPCICPKAVLWLRRAFRVMEPNEKMMLQGLPYYTFGDLESAGLSPRDVDDLSGDAFNGECALAALFSCLSTYSWPDGTSSQSSF
ncbi:unnamed protein product, partial [Prorocentrum cordatum]